MYTLSLCFNAGIAAGLLGTASAKLTPRGEAGDAGDLVVPPPRVGSSPGSDTIRRDAERGSTPLSAEAIAAADGTKNMAFSSLLS